MSELFALQTPLAELILRAAVIYFFLLIVMRIIGRHEFGQLTPFNLVLLLIISESISQAINAGDNSLLAGLISASTLLGLNVIISVAQYKNGQIRGIVSPGALKVIEDGRIIEKSLRRELMTHDDLAERLRAKGIAGVQQVRVAYIENDVDISALTCPESDRHQVRRASAAKKRQRGNERRPGCRDGEKGCAGSCEVSAATGELSFASFRASRASRVAAKLAKGSGGHPN